MPEIRDRPYTVLSCCMSLDGYLNAGTEERLVLSNEDDLDRVDAVRAACDAILVGAATVRNDNPRLLVRSPERIAWRRSQGLPAQPAKVTVTSLAKLDPDAEFFTAGDSERIVYCTCECSGAARSALGGVATVVDAGQVVDMRRLGQDLYTRGVRYLLVEGGGTVLTQFLTAGLADELQVGVAPFFVGDSRARRLVDDGSFPWDAGHRATLAEVRPVGDVVLLRYALSDRFA